MHPLCISLIVYTIHVLDFKLSDLIDYNRLFFGGDSSFNYFAPWEGDIGFSLNKIMAGSKLTFQHKPLWK
jgi:hypothetical protein